MLKVENWKIDKLIPYARNPRRNDAQVDRMVSAIKEFGFRIPVVAKSDGSVVDGHLRLKAAQKLGLKEVPVALADELTEAQVKAFRLLANKSANWAEWDDDLLRLELDELKDMDFDLSLTGFDSVELDDVFASAIGGTEGLTDADDVPEVQETPVTKEGDVWLLGKHRLMCGDSTDAGSVELLMNGQKGKILFTSPPYSNMRTYNGGNLETDNLAQFIPAYKPFVSHQFVNLGIQIKDREIVQYWDDYIKAAKDCGYKLMAWLVWDKGEAGSIGNQSHFVPTRHEFIFVFGNDAFDFNKTIPKKEKSINVKRTTHTTREKDGTVSRVSFGDTSNPFKTIESVINVTPQKARNLGIDHPAMFPVALPVEFINAATKEGDIVIEPFCGSGTTVIACEQQGRICYGMELSPQYCDVIVKRWQDFTGQKATLESNGKTFDEVANV